MAADDFLKELNEAIRLIQAGDPQQARPILYELSRTHPQQEIVWLWLAAAAYNDAERIAALERVLAINPRNPKARTALERLTGTSPLPPPPRIDLAKVKLLRVPAFKLPPGFWQGLQTALIIILAGPAAFVIIFLAGAVVVPALTPPSATPTATATRTPSPTVPSPTPLPTLTLPPTWTPEPTDTPRPANTLRPTLTPRPTLTRVPSRTPTPTFTRPPTLTPTPSLTVPSVTPTQASTPI